LNKCKNECIVFAYIEEGRMDLRKEEARKEGKKEGRKKGRKE
jgi:hypothetical protein